MGKDSHGSDTLNPQSLHRKNKIKKDEQSLRGQHPEESPTTGEWANRAVEVFCIENPHDKCGILRCGCEGDQVLDRTPLSSKHAKPKVKNKGKIDCMSQPPLKDGTK